MKNNKNRKRVLPLLLAMLLLIGAGAYGTRAFFSDQEALKTSIKITTGTIDIAAPSTYAWTYSPIEATNSIYTKNEKMVVTKYVDETHTAEPVAVTVGGVLGQQLTVSKARPGDAFTMDVEVKNNSTLDMLISDNFTAAIYEKGLYSFEFTNKLGAATIATDNSLNSEFTLIKAGETLTYKFKITVDTAANNTYNIVDLTQLTKFALDNITLNAKQPNAN